MIEQKVSMHELSQLFGMNYETAEEFDLSDMGLLVESKDSNGNECFKEIQSFIVKPSVDSHYQLGKLKGTNKHRVFDNGEFISLENHKDSIHISEPMNVVDIMVDDTHTYCANDQLNHNTTSGGKALGFHASVRLRLKSIGKIKKKTSVGDTIIGVQTRAIVVKNRLGPPQREADFDIYFDRGIDDYSSWLKTMKAHNLVKTAGAWYTYTEVDIETGEVGEDHKFQAKDFNELLENNPLLRENMYGRICDAVIMRYRSDEVDIDNTEIEETDE